MNLNFSYIFSLFENKSQSIFSQHKLPLKFNAVWLAHSWGTGWIIILYLLKEKLHPLPS